MYLRIIFFMFFLCGCSFLKKTDRNPADFKDESPLHLAIEEKDLLKIDTIIADEKSDLNFPDFAGDTPLHIVSERGYSLIMEKLLINGANTEMINDLKETPLHTATFYEQIDLVRMLLEFKANINPQDKKGETPLHIVVDSMNLDILNLLLADKNINVNLQDEYLQSPLITATYSSYFLGMQALLKHKNIALNLQNEDGDTFSHILIRYEYFKEKGIQLIKKLHTFKKINFNLTNEKGNTLLHEIARHLSGSDVNAIILDILNSKNPELSIRNNRGLTVRDILRDRGPSFKKAKKILGDYQRNLEIKNSKLKEKIIKLKEKIIKLKDLNEIDLKRVNEKILAFITKDSKLKNKTILNLEETIKNLQKKIEDMKK